jgi:hypothetical protein
MDSRRDRASVRPDGKAKGAAKRSRLLQEARERRGQAKASKGDPTRTAKGDRPAGGRGTLGEASKEKRRLKVNARQNVGHWRTRLNGRDVHKFSREYFHEVGRLGGKARAAKLTPEERQRIARAGGAATARGRTPAERSAVARKAALARWKRAK